MTKILPFIFAACFSSALFAQSPGIGEVAASPAIVVSAGPALPIGNFAAASGGAARLGAALSAEFAVGTSTAWVSGIILAYNPTDAGTFPVPAGSDVAVGPWWTLWPMSGMQWRMDASPGLSFHLLGQIGLFIGSSPAVSIHSPIGDASVSADRAVGVSTGIGGGITLEERYTLGIRYLYANPGYEVTITDLGVTSTDHAHQPTALIMVSLGLAL